jgi:hypothetical protein
VDGAGRLVAEGLQGPAGANGKDAQDLWARNGTELSPKAESDSIYFGGALKVGGSKQSPGAIIATDGELRIGDVFSANPGARLWPDGTLALGGSGLVFDPRSNRLEVFGNIQTGSVQGSVYSCNFHNLTSASDFSFIAGPTSLVIKTGAANETRAQITSVGDFLIGGALPTSPAFVVTAQGFLVSKATLGLVFADNAAARAFGLQEGHVYRKPDGTLMIAF